MIFGKSKFLKQFVPYKYGGGIVERVNNSTTKFREAPQNLEAGTPNIAGVIGMGKAIQFIQKIGLKTICNHELHLKKYLQLELGKIDGITIYHAHNSGELNSQFASPIFSFNVKNIHHYDLSVLLAENNILARSGDLCSQTFMKVLGVDGSVRISLCFYNTQEEIDSFILALKKVIKLLNISS